jgi:hypothetical protein
MNFRKVLAGICVAVLGITVAVSPSWAGSKQKHRWEGVAIGIGAAILGKAIIDSYYQQTAPSPYSESYVIEHHHYHQPPPKPAGYWETQKEWIPPAYEKRWNPGHYNRHGRWEKGSWIRVEVEPGHWEYKKVWVPYY